MRYVYDPLTKLYIYSTATETPENSTTIEPVGMGMPKWDGTKWIDQQPPKQSVQDQIDQLKQVDGMLGGQIAQLIARQ